MHRGGRPVDDIISAKSEAVCQSAWAVWWWVASRMAYAMEGR